MKMEGGPVRVKIRGVTLPDCPIGVPQDNLHGLHDGTPFQQLVKGTRLKVAKKFGLRKNSPLYFGCLLQSLSFVNSQV
jgi:hypothetical protein